jgi:Secretion system C-terminal sorting domain
MKTIKNKILFLICCFAFFYADVKSQSNLQLKIVGLQYTDTAQLGVNYHLSFLLMNTGTDTFYSTGILQISAIFDSAKIHFHTGLSAQAIDTFSIPHKIKPGDSMTLTGGNGFAVNATNCRISGENEIIIWPGSLHGIKDSTTLYDSSFFYLKGNLAGIASTKDFSNQFVIYPNPCVDELRVTNHELKIKKVEVLNVVGQNVNCPLQIDNSTYNFRLLTYDLSSGIYLLKITDDKGLTNITKFFKQQ